MIGVLVSRRPHLVDQAVAIAEAFCDEVRVVIDRGDFLAALREGFDLDEPAFKLDDDDWYPPDHDRLATHYKPGRVVWNELDVEGCDGQPLGRRRFISGGILPPGVRFRADPSGRIEASLGAYGMAVAYTGSRKYQCPAQWSWNDKPAWGSRIRCDH